METVGVSTRPTGAKSIPDFPHGNLGCHWLQCLNGAPISVQLRGLFLAALIAAIYSFIAFKVRDDRSRMMTPRDRRFLAHEQERLRRQHVEHTNRQLHNNSLTSD